MKVVLVGASGTIGKHVKALLVKEGHEVISVGRSKGDFLVDISDRKAVKAMYEKIGAFDALVSASGEVAFAPLSELSQDKWDLSLGSKLTGQINLVLEGIPFIREKGSFTLVSGIVGEEPIATGTAAATVNGALEAFVRAAALELPKGLRINIVSPTWLDDSPFGPYFPGFLPVTGEVTAQAFKRSIMGIQNGAVIKAR